MLSRVAGGKGDDCEAFGTVLLGRVAPNPALDIGLSLLGLLLGLTAPELVASKLLSMCMSSTKLLSSLGPLSGRSNWGGAESADEASESVRPCARIGTISGCRSGR